MRRCSRSRPFSELVCGFLDRVEHELGVVLLHRRRPRCSVTPRCSALLTTRTIQRPSAPDVEDVDARGRLLEAAEEAPLARQGVREDRAVDAAVEDGERRVPGRIRDDLSSAGTTRFMSSPIVSPPRNRVSARDRAGEGAGERRLEPVLGDVLEPSRPQLLELGPRLRLPARRDDPRRLHRPPSPLVITRSSSTPASALPASSPARRRWA